MCYDEKEEKKPLDSSLLNSIRALCPKCTENIPVLTITEDETKVLIDCPPINAWSLSKTQQQKMKMMWH